jgi:drug/metabolite transporter (DMT)-like permease
VRGSTVTGNAGDAPAAPLARTAVIALSTYFVVVWGAGFVASRIALQYAAPFSYIGVRYTLALAVAFVAFGRHARWPRAPRDWGHAVVAGLLSHAGYLGGSHYAQRWGLSAGVTALVLALQPLLTAVVVSRWLHERLGRMQAVGVAVGLAGVALVVGERALAGSVSALSIVAILAALACVTAGTLYQRQFCADSDLRAAVCIHFAATALVMLPLGLVLEHFEMVWNAPIAGALAYHVVLGSIGAYSILHFLMRHGQATGVTSLLYLTPPVAALVEWAVFGSPPTATMWLGMAVACVGVAMTTWRMTRVARGPIVEEPS